MQNIKNVLKDNHKNEQIFYIFLVYIWKNMKVKSNLKINFLQGKNKKQIEIGILPGVSSISIKCSSSGTSSS